MILESAPENLKRGEELNHLAGLLFLRSASEWNWSIALQIVSSSGMVLVSEFAINHELKLALALGCVALFGVAYYFRFTSEDTFDCAETMRRQSAFCEGLGWPVNNHQYAEWKSRAGQKVLNQFKNSTRPEGYWETQMPPGPRRLLELTIESSFWGRKLYKKLRGLMWTAFLAIIGLALLLIFASLAGAAHFNEEASSVVAAIFLLLPALLIFDILEWILKLNRFIDGMKEVEMDMDRLAEQSEITEPQVLRLVAEYNAVVAGGFPIHPKLYARWHDEIKELWDARR